MGMTCERPSAPASVSPPLRGAEREACTSRSWRSASRFACWAFWIRSSLVLPFFFLHWLTKSSSFHRVSLSKASMSSSISSFSLVAIRLGPLLMISTTVASLSAGSIPRLTDSLRFCSKVMASSRGSTKAGLGFLGAGAGRSMGAGGGPPFSIADRSSSSYFCSSSSMTYFPSMFMFCQCFSKWSLSMSPMMRTSCPGWLYRRQLSNIKRMSSRISRGEVYERLAPFPSSPPSFFSIVERSMGFFTICG
mmetsp:Transcript_4328/g.12107  ORF Transcript_4328/g.12107 Transcript_4328/m.12107 type:complete len:249 (-) Transcript_4328:230-976(-)